VAASTRRPGDPETKIDVVYGDGKGMYDGFVNMYRSMRFLETVAANSAAHYKWPRPFTLKMESCGHAGTDYDDEARVVTICYETPFDFAELYRAYVQPPTGSGGSTSEHAGTVEVRPYSSSPPMASKWSDQAASSTRYTDARPMLRAFANSHAPKPCAFIAHLGGVYRSRAALVDAGRLRLAMPLELALAKARRNCHTQEMVGLCVLRRDLLEKFGSSMSMKANHKRQAIRRGEKVGYVGGGDSGLPSRWPEAWRGRSSVDARWVFFAGGWIPCCGRIPASFRASISRSAA
jgi:hypothetical protein